MPDPVYVLDANVFIEAARRYYAFDLAPRFWEQLIFFKESQRIASIDKVWHELQRGNDELAEWANNEFSNGFLSTDNEETIAIYGQIVNWVQNQDQYLDAAKTNFANSADGWLVAFAKANDYIVVTHESFDPNIRNRIPIPNICQNLEMQPVDTFAMLRELGIQFI